MKLFNRLFTPSIRPFLQKVSLSLLIGGLFVFLLYRATTPPLPSSSDPILFYANHARQDLKLTLCEAIRSSSHSIYGSFYGITDHDMIDLLAQKSAAGIDVTMEYDPTASLSLTARLPPPAKALPRHSKGLMHRKILITDDTLVFLGSANLTVASLRHHSNLILGLHAPALAQFIKNPPTTFQTFQLGAHQLEFYLLPDPEHKPLNRLIETIHTAAISIQIAMFTLTHPDLVAALVEAAERGVAVTAIVDYYTGRGASKNALMSLEEGGVKVLLSQGQELLHHKWALVDHSTLVMGSANWTKAAFSKNEDFLLFFSPLSRDEKKFLTNLWETLRVEATTFKL